MDDTAQSPRARRAALDVLVRVDRDGAYADRALDAVLRRRTGFTARDKGLVTELVYGTLRHAIYIDFILGRLATRPLRKTPVQVRNALRMGAHQILNMRVPSHAAVNETVKLVRGSHRSATGFVNAMLRKISTFQKEGQLPEPDDSDPIDALAITGSHPDWLLREIEKRQGLDETRAFVDANNQTPPLMLRANPLRIDRDRLDAELKDAGLEVDIPSFLPHGLEVRGAGHITELPAFQEGRCSVQDYAAQMVTLLAEPRPAMTVLDACAAPGGKSCHAAELMNDEGRIFALDIHPGRTRLIHGNAQRLGLVSIHTVALDASDGASLHHELIALDAETVDLALVDAPCSGLGTIRRHPELRLRKESELPSLIRLQSQLLESVGARVKAGGRLVYSVCTVTRAEGIERVRDFLSRHSEFQPSWPELPAFNAMRVEHEGIPCLETWPHRHGVDGFFAVRLDKKS